MLKMSDTGNHNESSPIPNSVETVIPKPVHDIGSAVKTYRQLQIEKAHLPIELWESDVFGPEGDRNP